MEDWLPVLSVLVKGLGRCLLVSHRKHAEDRGWKLYEVRTIISLYAPLLTYIMLSWFYVYRLLISIYEQTYKSIC